MKCFEGEAEEVLLIGFILIGPHVLKINEVSFEEQVERNGFQRLEWRMFTLRAVENHEAVFRERLVRKALSE